MTDQTDDLRAQVARIKVGDHVVAEFRRTHLDGETRLYTVSDEAVQGSLSVLLGAFHTLRWLDGTPGPSLVRIIEHTPARIPIPGTWGVVKAESAGLPPRRRWILWDDGLWRDWRGDEVHWDDLIDPILIRPGIEDGER